RQVDPRSQRGFLGYSVIKLILQSLQSSLGGGLRRLEGHRVDLEEHVAFLDRPVGLDRHLGDLPSYARNDWDDIIHGSYVMRGWRHDVHEENQGGQRDDR